MDLDPRDSDSRDDERHSLDRDRGHRQSPDQHRDWDDSRQPQDHERDDEGQQLGRGPGDDLRRSETDSRYRRPVSTRLAIERLTILDAMLESPDLSWLGTEAEKVAFFSQRAPTLPRECLPHKTVGPFPGRLRLFPEDLPIGVDGTGRVVFLYLVTTCVDLELHAFVQRRGDLLRALPAWTIRLVSPPDGAGLEASENTVRYELTNQLSPEIIRKLRWYFEQCRTTTDARARSYTDENFWLAQAAFSARSTGRFTAAG